MAYEREEEGGGTLTCRSLAEDHASCVQENQQEEDDQEEEEEAEDEQEKEKEEEEKEEENPEVPQEFMFESEGVIMDPKLLMFAQVRLQRHKHSHSVCGKQGYGVVCVLCVCV